jgi:hypothetical protein
VKREEKQAKSAKQKLFELFCFLELTIPFERTVMTTLIWINCLSLILVALASELRLHVMKLFVRTARRVEFVECSETDTFEDVRERVAAMSEAVGRRMYVGRSCFLILFCFRHLECFAYCIMSYFLRFSSIYCGEEVQYSRSLLDYNIRHSGYVVHWV